MTFRLVAASAPPMDHAVIAERAGGYPVEIFSAPLATDEEVAEHTVGADGVLVATNPLPRPLVEAFAPSVRIIGRAGVGLDAIDLEAAAERGVAVFHTPDYCVPEVATHAVALLLALNRRLIDSDRIARSDWHGWRAIAPIKPLDEQTVGLVGFGRIGRAVAERVRPLVASVLAYDPYGQVNEPGVLACPSLDQLLTSSDVVSLHLPLSPETRRFIGAPELARMRPGAALVNVSRGGLVDEPALAEALASGHLSGAALDVMAEEPPPLSSPLLSAPNVVLSPHTAWYSVASERRVWTMTLGGVVDVLEGRPPTAGRLVPVG
jgi:D-3-phosphoglycerate dehydrogenase